MSLTLVDRIRSRRFLERYLATAIVTWTIYGALSATLLHTGLPTWIAGGSAYLVALAIHFSMHRFLVFRRAELEYHHDLTTQIWRYLSTAAAQYLFTLAGTALLVSSTGVHRSIAYFGCALFAAGLNFLALRFLIFPPAAAEATPAPVPSSSVTPASVPSAPAARPKAVA